VFDRIPVERTARLFTAAAIGLAGSLISGIVVPPAAQAQAIKVTLLGTGSPIPIIERFGPSILVEAHGEKLLFDVGRGASVRLWQSGVALGDISAVFFTHLHSDHVSGFPDFWLTSLLPNKSWGHRNEALHVYGPAGTKNMMAHVVQAYAGDIHFREADEKVVPAVADILAEDISEGVVYDKNGVKVTAFLVDHGEPVKPVLGYRIDYAGHSVVLSGDTRVSENLIRFAAGCDVLFHEVAAAKPGILAQSEPARRIVGHHTTPEEAAGVFERVKPRLAVYTHIVLLTTVPDIPPPTVADVIAATSARYKGALEMGEDLMSVDVGEKITVRRNAHP
jgi:ribonuclease Z